MMISYSQYLSEYFSKYYRTNGKYRISEQRKYYSDSASKVTTLTLDRVEPTDTGIYQCRASSDYDVAQSHSVVMMGGMCWMSPNIF